MLNRHCRGNKPRLWRGVFGLVVAAFAHADDNLVANGGFEELSGTSPARWDVYVKAAPGASGKLAPEAHGGKQSVKLEVGTPYEADPLNNWSQNVIGEFGGKQLRLQGFVKTQDVTDAAIWAQCWRKSPQGVLLVASTGTRAPIYGTKDWEETWANFDVPQKTDFITVRCVIKGTGIAWFDDISLTEIGVAKRKEEIEPPKASPEMPAAKPKEPPKRSPLGEKIHDDLENMRLQEENRLLKDMVDSLKSSNEDLSRRVKALEEKGAPAAPQE